MGEDERAVGGTLGPTAFVKAVSQAESRSPVHSAQVALARPVSVFGMGSWGRRVRPRV